jgi:hypothetical protein
VIGIGIRLLIVAAFLAAFAFAVHKYNEHFRDEGRAEVQAVFDAYKVAQDKQRADIILDYVGKLAKAHDDKVRNDTAALARMAILDVAVGNVVNTAAGIRIPADVRRVLDASAAAANGRLAPADGGGQARPEAVPAAPEAAASTYDEREFAKYLKDGPDAYQDAFGLWDTCRKREDACRDARAKGNAP